MSQVGIDHIANHLALAMQRDRFRLRRLIQEIKRKKLTADSRQFSQLMEIWNRSTQLRQTREQAFPTAKIDANLPLFEHASEIQQMITDHQVVVISGETGSGKSTQLPLLCLQAGFGVGGMIGHTQPRRIADRGVASRIASQLKTKLGCEVGFKIRFSDQSSDQTLIKLMTDGILLAETQTDRFLDQYEVLIIDEAHERSLNIDFLLGYLKKLIHKRSDLRVIITSATIDTKRFADHFTTNSDRPVPTIHVEGRAYPVDIQYMDFSDDSADEMAPEDAVVQAVSQLASQDAGDILVFLPTEHDIRITAQKLRGKHFAADRSAHKTEILPLYARLSNEQQNLIFQPGAQRRIVLATNVAESSITVPRIRYVVDTGTARMSRYAPRSKVQRLPIEAISQASADQRAGRCGRVGPGICLRLYSEDDYNNRAKFTTPEIRRTNLASVILQTQALKLGAVEDFPFIDPPRPESIRDGYKTLFEIGAVDERHELTPLGRKLSRLPVDPRIGRMLFAASEHHCLAEVLVIAAALEVQDPRLRPPERRQAADERHQRFNHEESDFLAWLNLWDFFHQLREKLSRSRFRKACQENFLSFMQIQQWSDVHRQLRQMARQAGLHYASRRDDYQAIHTSLATGLLSGIAMKSDKYEYTGAGGTKFHLWPGSGLFEKRPAWIIAAEVVETTKRFGRTIARIEPDWIEPLAKHLVKTKHVDPHWSKKNETVMAYENVSLFGLPIVNRRRINYVPVDPEASRTLFIEKGLAEGELRRPPEFLKQNLETLQGIQELATKTRRRDLVVDEHAIVDFYESRIPEDCADMKQLHRILKRNPDLKTQLVLSADDLLGDQESVEHHELFPDEVSVGNIRLPVSYRFMPGEKDDGATLEVPVEAAAQLDEHQLGWLVPGLISDRVEAMIRSLPKSIRRNLIPASETARLVAEQLELGDGSLVETIAQHLSNLAGEPIRADMFDDAKIDPRLKLNVRLTDTSGNVVAESRSLADVVRKLPEEQKSSVVETGDTTWHQDHLTEWIWDELPKSITIKRGVADVPVYPTLIDQGDSVGLRLLDQRTKSNDETRQGLVRLFQIANRKLVRSQVNWLPEFNRLTLLASQIFSGTDAFKSAVGDLIVRIGFVVGEQIPRTQADYAAFAERAAERISVATQEVAKWLPNTLEKYHEAQISLEAQPSKNSHAVGDVRQQLQSLFGENFLVSSPWHRLKHYPRYLAAVAVRLEKLASGNFDKDCQLTREIGEYTETYRAIAQQLDELGKRDEELDQLKWMIEEYRVSLFAQQLGTSEKVSPQRIEKQIAKARASIA